MARLTQQALDAVVAQHARWLKDHAQGARADLRRMTIAELRLENVDLSYALCDYVDASHVTCINVDWTSASLNNSVFARSNLRDCKFDDAQLRDANFYSALCTNCSFTHAELKGAQLFLPLARLTVGGETISVGGTFTHWNTTVFRNADILTADTQAVVAGHGLMRHPPVVTAWWKKYGETVCCLVRSVMQDAAEQQVDGHYQKSS